jgi:hypothetical protein
MRVSLDEGAILIEETSNATVSDLASLLNHKYAIAFRDELVCLHLSALGCKKLVDFGSDFGSLLFHAERRKIEALGVEPDPIGRVKSMDAKLQAMPGDIQGFLDRGSETQAAVIDFLGASEGKTAVSFLNIFHKEDTEEPILRKTLWEFVDASLSAADFVVLTATKRQVRRLRAMGAEVTSLDLLRGKIPTRNALNLMIYGRTFFSGGLTGFANSVEEYLWRLILGRRAFPDSLRAYPSMVILASRQRATSGH